MPQYLIDLEMPPLNPSVDDASQDFFKQYNYLQFRFNQYKSAPQRKLLDEIDVACSRCEQLVHIIVKGDAKHNSINIDELSSFYLTWAQVKMAKGENIKAEYLTERTFRSHLFLNGISVEHCSTLKDFVYRAMTVDSKIRLQFRGAIVPMLTLRMKSLTPADQSEFLDMLVFVSQLLSRYSRSELNEFHDAIIVDFGGQVLTTWQELASFENNEDIKNHIQAFVDACFESAGKHPSEAMVRLNRRWKDIGIATSETPIHLLWSQRMAALNVKSTIQDVVDIIHLSDFLMKKLPYLHDEQVSILESGFISSIEKIWNRLFDKRTVSSEQNVKFAMLKLMTTERRASLLLSNNPGEMLLLSDLPYHSHEVYQLLQQQGHILIRGAEFFIRFPLDDREWASFGDALKTVFRVFEVEKRIETLQILKRHNAGFKTLLSARYQLLLDPILSILSPEQQKDFLGTLITESSLTQGRLYLSEQMTGKTLDQGLKLWSKFIAALMKDLLPKPS
jgi:hypothetical protein